MQTETEIFIMNFVAGSSLHVLRAAVRALSPGTVSLPPSGRSGPAGRRRCAFAWADVYHADAPGSNLAAYYHFVGVYFVDDRNGGACGILA